MQYWPRKRAKKLRARIRNWSLIDGTLPAFIGYKAGMTHVIINDTRPSSMTKGQRISLPVTVIECPPIKSVSLHFYKKTPYGLKQISSLFSSKLDKNLKIKISKKQKEPEDFDELRLLVHTQPELINLKKKPDLLELPVPGNTNEEKLKLAKELLEKEIKINELFKEGSYTDVHAVTKGKGYQGAVKRFGVPLLQHKSEKKKRGVASLGAWNTRSMWRVPFPGKMGYHQRMDHNKQILKISSKPEEINPKGGFVNYGLIKTDFILLKGSVPGHIKNPIVISKPIRQNKKPYPLEIVAISLRSKQ